MAAVMCSPRRNRRYRRAGVGEDMDRPLQASDAVVHPCRAPVARAARPAVATAVPVELPNNQKVMLQQGRPLGRLGCR